MELTNIQFGTLVVVGTSGGKPYGHVDISFAFAAPGHPQVVMSIEDFVSYEVLYSIRIPVDY